jgi:Domain of unknown function (DUF222)
MNSGRPERQGQLTAGFTAAAAIATALDEPMTTHAVARLADVDPEQLADELRVPLIQAWERADAWLQARKQRALAAVADATIRCGNPGDEARFEVGAALRLSPNTAADRVWVATQLTGKLSATLAAMATGDVTYWQAHNLAHAVVGLTDDQVGAVERRVLTRAPDQSLADTKRAIARAVIAADPLGATARAKDQARERSVRREPGYDGSAMLTAIGPAAAIDTIYTALSATGRQLKLARLRARSSADAAPDPVDTSMDACRFDALEALCAGALADPGLPTHQHARPAVQVTIDLATLLGLAERPGELIGHGAIPPAIARELAADADWSRFVTDPMTSELLDLGRRTYRPGPALTRFITARDRTCSFPACNAPATRCDIDHIDEFDHDDPDRGGPTTRANLAPHCRQHHNAKTHGGWQVARWPDGTIVWTSPQGHTYRVPPARHPAAVSADADSDPPDDG